MLDADTLFFHAAGVALSIGWSPVGLSNHQKRENPLVEDWD
jgi:hypothetical protein